MMTRKHEKNELPVDPIYSPCRVIKLFNSPNPYFTVFYGSGGESFVFIWKRFPPVTYCRGTRCMGNFCFEALSGLHFFKSSPEFIKILSFFGLWNFYSAFNKYHFIIFYICCCFHLSNKKQQKVLE